MEATTIEVTATVLFALGVLHTFCVRYFKRLAHRFREGSVGENVFHLLGEVEAVFLFWALLLVCAMGLQSGWHDAVHHMETLNFTEPIFVFVIMTMASTKPVVDAAGRSMQTIANLLPCGKGIAFTWTALVFGPLLGSFITEPAAMTVTALLLKKRLFDWDIPKTLKYAALGTLFVNVSIGGTMTNYAAPPILMVKEAFGWSSMDIFGLLGWKAIVACIASATALCFWFRQDLLHMDVLQSILAEDEHEDADDEHEMSTPLWVTAVHVAFLAFVVLHAHHMVMFMGAFLYFLGFVTVTKEYQTQLELRSALMVAGFLGGLVTLGSLQSWWLQPTLAAMNELGLYFGATGLTAVTDNAALTYLGSRVENLSDPMKYALVAGAVTGGGLTVIANAPNPAGNSILETSFGENGIAPGGLLLGALFPTAVAVLCFLFLPSL